MAGGSTLRRIVPQQAAQTFAVAATLKPTLGFIRAVAADGPAGTFFSRRLGHAVCLRPRGDLQVARELLSKDAYRVPPEVAQALSTCAEPFTFLDLGANIGLFSLSAIHAFGPRTRIRAVEPDPANLTILKHNIQLTDNQERIEVHEAAAGVHGGSAAFVSGLRYSSHLARAGENADEAVSVTVIDAFELAAGCAMVKIDIEGSEWEILRDPRLSSLDAAAIALEWHTAGSNSDAPEQQAVTLLEKAGYAVGYTELQGSNGFLWAWRRSAS